MDPGMAQMDYQLIPDVQKVCNSQIPRIGHVTRKAGIHLLHRTRTPGTNQSRKGYIQSSHTVKRDWQLMFKETKVREHPALLNQNSLTQTQTVPWA